MKKRPVAARFWEKVQKGTEADACWLWTAAKDSHGYGVLKVQGRMVSAHRLVFSLQGLALDKGQYADLVCRVRHCVNPSHLRAVTPRQNALENSVGASAKNAKKTHCLRGHLLDEENTYLESHGSGVMRKCRTCRRFHRRKLSAAYRDAPRKPKPPHDVLAREITENSWMSLARKYGVSDNAVRKWARKYDLI